MSLSADGLLRALGPDFARSAHPIGSGRRLRAEAGEEEEKEEGRVMYRTGVFIYGICVYVHSNGNNNNNSRNNNINNSSNSNSNNNVEQRKEKVR